MCMFIDKCKLIQTLRILKHIQLKIFLLASNKSFPVLPQNAIAKLIRGNELELAVSLCRIMPNTKDLLEISTLLLARRCEKFGRW